jgi:dolichol-phosphate mannosyltransferase
VRTLVVIPTYDEAGNIEPLLRRLRAVVPAADVLVVDDASPDGTGAIAEALGRELGRMEVLHRPGKSGLGRAYREGFARGLAAGYEVIVQMDADLSHDPGALPSLLAPLEAGVADVVIGSRYVPGGSIPAWPWHRRALSRVGNRYATTVLEVSARDITSGYRAYLAPALAGLDLATVRADGYGFMIELARRGSERGVRFVEVPITFADRVRGESKMSARIIVEALVLVTAWGVEDRLRRRGRRRDGAASRRTEPAA